MDPLVSVLMVAHNASVYLEPAVASILGQSLTAIELVLVDNASTDGSIERLTAGCRDTRLRLLKQDRNLHHGGGLVAGLPYCRGQFVAIMDADDISLPDRLKHQVDRLAADRSLAAIGCAAATINADGKVVGSEFALFEPAEIRLYAQFDLPFNFPTLLIRRETLEATPIRPNIRPPFDLDWAMRALEKHDFACLRETCFHYRRHAASTTASYPVPIYAMASVVRIASARRRAGLPENLEALLAERDRVIETAGSVSEVLLYYSRLALGEGHWLQAVWHARKAAVHGRRLAGLKLVLAALAAKKDPAFNQQTELRRLAFLGTVRAYRLHPAMARVAG